MEPPHPHATPVQAKLSTKKYICWFSDSFDIMYVFCWQIHEFVITIWVSFVIVIHNFSTYFIEMCAVKLNVELV